METIFIIQIVQYAIENNKQLFLIVDDALFVDRIQINHIVILYKSLRMADGSCPVNLVVSPMQILDGEQHKIPILLIESDKRQHDIQVSIGLVPPAPARLGQMFVQDSLAVRISLIENAQCTIYPHREFRYELSILLTKFLLFLWCQYLLGSNLFTCWKFHAD